MGELSHFFSLSPLIHPGCKVNVMNRTEDVSDFTLNMKMSHFFVFASSSSPVPQSDSSPAGGGEPVAEQWPPAGGAGQRLSSDGSSRTGTPARAAPAQGVETHTHTQLLEGMKKLSNTRI